MNKKTLKNYLYNLSYQVLLVIAPLITAPYISHVLHPAGVGIYSYTTTIASAFALFAALGVNTYGQREIAYRQGDVKEQSIVFWELFITRIITTLIVGGCYIAFSIYYKQYTIYLLQQAFIVFATLLDISWYFQGIENFKIIAVRNIIIKILTIVLIFMLVKDEFDVGRYILINSFSIFASYGIFFLNLKKYIVTIDFKCLKIKRHLRGTIEFFIPLIATQLYSQLDKIMLGALTRSTIENGYYEQARKIVHILIMIIISINTVMYPRISNLYAQERKDEIVKLYKITFKMIAMMVVPIAIGLLFVSDNFVVWFYGDDYIPVSILLKLSGLLLIFMAIGNFVGMQYLSPTGKQNQMTVVYLISAVLNLGLNMIMIPMYQSLGAIIASIIAEVFSGLSQMWLLQKSNYKFNAFEGLWKYLCAGLVMALGLNRLRIINPFVYIAQTIFEVIVAAVIYFIVLVCVKEENVHNVIGIFRKRVFRQ